MNESLDSPGVFTGEEITEPGQDPVTVGQEQIGGQRNDNDVIDDDDDAPYALSDLTDRAEYAGNDVIQMASDGVGEDVGIDLNTDFGHFLYYRAKIHLGLLDQIRHPGDQSLHFIHQSGYDEKDQHGKEGDDREEADQDGDDPRYSFRFKQVHDRCENVGEPDAEDERHEDSELAEQHRK